MHVFTATLNREQPEVTLLVAQFSSELSFETLFEQIYTGYTEDRLRANALVIRADLRDQFSADAIAKACAGKALSSSPFLQALAKAYAEPKRHFDRFAEMPVLVLHANACEPMLSANVNPLTKTPGFIAAHVDHPETLADIRDCEMRCLVEKSRAYLLPIEGSYYEPPSHRPARSFLRVGNIQYSRQAVDASTFWLLPHLKDSRAILVDTWSLSSIAFNASRVLAALRGEAPVPVEMLSQYQDQSEERQAALIEILDRLVSDATRDGDEEDYLKMTCLVSATQTGSLIEVLKDQVSLSGLNVTLNFVALFRLGAAGDLPALCDLSDQPGFAPLDQNELGSRAAIPIDAQVYFPLTYQDIHHLPMQPDAAPFEPFLDLVQGHGIVSTHRDQPSDGAVRHHGIHVDTAQLFALPAFQNRFRAAIQALDPQPSLILTPLHAAAHCLAEIAATEIEAATGIAPIRIEHTSLQFTEEGPRAAVDAAVRGALLAVPEDTAILILDDCFVTGARMTGYQSRLRQIAIKPRIHYLVGLARPDDPAKWTRFCRLVAFRSPDTRAHFQQNTIGSVIETCLPNWQRNQCPWCQEALLLQHLVRSVPDEPIPEFLSKRQALLNDTAPGLRDDLFLVDAGHDALKLYSGSLFARVGSSQAEVFAALSAALQRLRVHAANERPLLGARRYPVATVIKADEYLHMTYTDSILRASFLRGAVPEELIYTAAGMEKKRGDMITAIMTAPEQDIQDLALELVLAHAARKCTIAEDLDTKRLPPDAAGLLKLVRTPPVPDGKPPNQDPSDSWSD